MPARTVGQRVGIAHVESDGVAPLRIERDRHRQARVCIGVEPLELGDRIADDIEHRYLLVHEAIHEGGVGAVLEQTAHQVGEQVLVLAHRRIDAHGRKALDLALGLRIEEPAHAVQPLELV